MTRVDDLAVEVEVQLAAPPEAVFALLSDVERTAGLGPEHHTARWVDGTRGVGARFTGSNQRGERAWDVQCEVVAFDPPRVFGWRVGDAEAPTGTWAYELTPDGEGTRVVQRFRHGPGWSFLRRAVEKHPDREEAFVAGRAEELAANMRAVLEAVGRLLADGSEAPAARA